jgi:perosamine synthetase
MSSISHSKPWITQEDKEYVSESLTNGFLLEGPMLKKFNGDLTQYFETENIIVTTSGTNAIILALLDLNIGTNDYVAAPTYVCEDVMQAIKAVGAIPLILDTNEQGLLNVDSFEGRITKQVKAIIAVHIFGFPCDVRALMNFGIPVIEDACHAFGMKMNSELAGTIGDYGVYSFHATKCLTTGTGGLLIKRDNAEKSNKSILKKSEIDLKFIDKRSINEMQAALGISQLNRYSSFVCRRQEIRLKYDEALSSLDNFEKNYQETNVLFRYTLRSNLPFETVKKHFKKLEIEVRRGVDKMLHQHISMDDSYFPNSCKLYEENISIPFYPSLSDYEVARVCNALKELNSDFRN